MKYLVCLFCLSFPAMVFSQKDSTAIIQLLKNDYATMANMDIKSHMHNCTDDYLLIEAGDIRNMEKESEWYKDDANKVTERKDYFDIKYVQVNGNVCLCRLQSKIGYNQTGKVDTRQLD